MTITDKLASQLEMKFIKRGSNVTESYSLDDHIGTNNLTERMRGVEQIIVNVEKLAGF